MVAAENFLRVRLAVSQASQQSRCESFESSHPQHAELARAAERPMHEQKTMPRCRQRHRSVYEGCDRKSRGIVVMFYCVEAWRLVKVDLTLPAPRPNAA